MAQLRRLSTAGGVLQSLPEYLEFELHDDPDRADPNDISYLTEEDRADPEIVANVQAMTATNKLIVWFGQDYMGSVGFWRGPEQSPIDNAPIVRLDTEGQYSLVAATLADYVCISTLDEEDFHQARAVLLHAGFDVAASPDEVWAAIEGLDGPNGPNAYRDAIYDTLL